MCECVFVQHILCRFEFIHRCEFRNGKSKIKRKMKIQIYLFTLDEEFWFFRFFNEVTKTTTRTELSEHERYALTWCVEKRFFFLSLHFGSIMWSHAVIWIERDARKTSKFAARWSWRMDDFNDNGTLICDVFGRIWTYLVRSRWMKLFFLREIWPLDFLGNSINWYWMKIAIILQKTNLECFVRDFRDVRFHWAGERVWQRRTHTSPLNAEPTIPTRSPTSNCEQLRSSRELLV